MRQSHLLTIVLTGVSSSGGRSGGMLSYRYCYRYRSSFIANAFQSSLPNVATLSILSLEGKARQGRQAGRQWLWYLQLALSRRSLLLNESCVRSIRATRTRSLYESFFSFVFTRCVSCCTLRAIHSCVRVNDAPLGFRRNKGPGSCRLRPGRRYSLSFASDPEKKREGLTALLKNKKRPRKTPSSSRGDLAALRQQFSGCCLLLL